ncbi:MAG TPA: glycosyltransferase [Thermoanaerobaculia bacterium]|jgi:O-antigen/teichoic acid export membrane protein/glycosyltransferase involved in cell wall biosynthesis|nr:glycosyltransferase [Thermoanaerobaculia bacterium]
MHLHGVLRRRQRRVAALPLRTSDGTAERLQADVVHFPSQGGFVTSIPSIYHPWDLQHVHHPEFFTAQQLLSRDLWYRTYCSQATIVSVATEWGKRDLVEHLEVDAPKIEVIPVAPVLTAYTSPTAADVAAARARFDLPEQFAYYPAQTWPHKNHLAIIRALALLRSRGVIRQVVFSGSETPYAREIRAEAVRLGVQNQVRLLGFVSPLTVQCLYALATCLIFPSRFEGWGMPISEAFLAGVPVASSNASCLPETAAGAALLFDPDDIEGIAGTIETLFTDEALRRELVHRGREVVQRLSWRSTASRFRELYLRIARNSDGAPMSDGRSYDQTPPDDDDRPSSASPAASVTRNMVANYFGQGWRALMILAFVPIYIRYLGIEAYGLIGIFTVLQSWMNLLDMGMRPALTREMARFTAGGIDVQNIRDLLRTVESLALLLATGAGVVIWSLSGWLATNWLNVQDLDVSVVGRAVAIMGVVAALRFLETIYVGSVIGLQRQVLENTVSSIMATLRGVGAVAVLAWVSPTITAFFVWQGLISLLTVVVYSLITHRVLPRPPRAARFSLGALQGIWRFAAGMIVITLLGLLLTQVDKMLLSRLLPLREFGYYALAGTATGALYMLTLPISTAFYPRFVELATQQDPASLRISYHQAAQLTTVIVGTAGAILILFARRILLVWTGDSALTENVAPILTVLAGGAMLNCFMWIPYYLQLAHGWTRLTVNVNTVAVALLVPTILVLVPRYGAFSAASAWLVLNAGYVAFLIGLMHRRLLTTEKARWYRDDVAIPLVLAFAAAGLCRVLLSEQPSRIGGMLALAGTGAITLFAAASAAPTVRGVLLRRLRGWGRA